MFIDVSQVQNHPHFSLFLCYFNGFMTVKSSLLHSLTQPEATRFLISLVPKNFFHPHSWGDFQKKLVQVVPQMARLFTYLKHPITSTNLSPKINIFFKSALD